MNTVWDLTHSIHAITWEVNKQFATILQSPVQPGTLAHWFHLQAFWYLWYTLDKFGVIQQPSETPSGYLVPPGMIAQWHNWWHNGTSTLSGIHFPICR